MGKRSTGRSGSGIGGSCLRAPLTTVGKELESREADAARERKWGLKRKRRDRRRLLPLLLFFLSQSPAATFRVCGLESGQWLENLSLLLARDMKGGQKPSRDVYKA
ncbi:hypothetical protein CRG98_023528 [Punica granatum]|uniref:Uncharacterized protein n=1 Tax=Punica granatum TaxID=22663 RepID=A0A2I0JIG5_PUNGR|nr:hypothetical protein CRG98_023528 [Punica granatum]